MKLRENNFMLDIETLGLKPGSVIFSVGVVWFNPTGIPSFGRFYTRVCIKSCVAHGLTIDPETMLWWMDQPDAAREEMTQPERSSLTDALTELSAFIENSVCGEPFHAWGNAASFDCGLLRAAYEACGIPCPWDFRDEMCYRTVKNLADDSLKPESDGTKHHALDDAMWQVEHLLRIFGVNE